MTLDMNFKHIEPTESIKAYAAEKSQKLQKYFRGRVNVHWFFTVENNNHIAHCHVTGTNMDYNGEAATDGMYASIDLAIDKIERQVRKHKEIVKDHLHRNGQRFPAAS